MKHTVLSADETPPAADGGRSHGPAEHRMDEEILRSARRGDARNTSRLRRITSEMRAHAMDHVAVTGQALGRARGIARVSQVVDYAFRLLYGLLAIRLVLALVSARSSNAFVQFIDAVTNPFCAPFRGIVASPTVEGGYTLALPILVAIIVFALLHAAINGLLRMLVTRKTAI
jgi:uncharacterized protein YggT (Ycf19 family)